MGAFVTCIGSIRSATVGAVVPALEGPDALASSLRRWQHKNSWASSSARQVTIERPVCQ